MSIPELSRGDTNDIDETTRCDYLSDFDVSFFKVSKADTVRLDEALRLEQKIWDENDFGSLDEYEIYNQQSRVISVYRDGECVGVTRLFDGAPELPPFMHLPFYEQSDEKLLAEYCSSGQMEELGTTAVDHKASMVPPGVISTHMWRIAYRDARSRGMKYWGIIMEPERVKAMNDSFNFTFRQLGPVVDYQGGDCAAFIMDLQEVDEQMSQSAPDLYDWFVNQELGS